MRKLAKLMEEMIARAPDQWVALQPAWDRDYTGLADADSGTKPAGLEPTPPATTSDGARDGSAAAPMIAAGQGSAPDPELSPATEREKAGS
jgi:hypothetical protein